MSQLFETSPVPPPPKKPNLILKFILCTIAFVLIVGAVGGYLMNRYLTVPGSFPSRDVEITINPGTTLNTLAKQLEELRVTSSARNFILMARWKDAGDKIKSGRFLVSTSWPPGKVLDHLINGLPLLDRVTIPEGLTWWETGKRLEAVGLVKFEDFKTVIFDPPFLRHWGIYLSSAEGFLFPDTYFFVKPLELNVSSAKIIVGRMIDTFWRRTASLWPGGKRPGSTQAGIVRERVTMASIIEKETSIAEERARVAGVYANRLETKMLLQADPTIVYGIGESFSGSILKSQLQDDKNKYNTYKHPGLPPGPICSPGLACLRAAFQPEQHNYLYFVARGDGSHIFSTNLADHNRAVRMYRSQVDSGDTPSLLPGNK